MKIVFLFFVFWFSIAAKIGGWIFFEVYFLFSSVYILFRAYKV